MSVVAIISEYNPFHNGHKYQSDRIRDELPGSTIISIMSGNVVQRGEFAFVDKYTRSRLAVENGIDCVFELPYPYSGSTAEIFATAGVKIANSLGADYLYFGIESNNLNDIEKIADIHQVSKANTNGIYAPSKIKCNVFLKSSSGIVKHFLTSSILPTATIMYNIVMLTPYKNNCICISFSNSNITFIIA